MVPTTLKNHAKSNHCEEILDSNHYNATIIEFNVRQCSRQRTCEEWQIRSVDKCSGAIPCIGNASCVWCCVKPAEDALVKSGAILEDNHRFVRGFSVGIDYDKDQGSSVTITLSPIETFNQEAVVERFTKSLEIFQQKK